MNYSRPDVRLAILKLLSVAPAYTANQETLLVNLRVKGFALNRDQVKIELSWLEGQANAITDHPIGGVHIATLTQDGMEIIEGLIDIPGISKPQPGEIKPHG